MTALQCRGVTHSRLEVIMYKKSGREIYFGPFAESDIASWSRSSSDSALISLHANEVQLAIHDTQRSWFIKFIVS
eukprot:CAMPEP_0182936380 /NCGR_PEP_ID=MMETSP0105_2-20130417/40122_1 /TAXON_ID=81532 ORGANISM="Acanthoeca-like sp., Strain 10tr" /NCGR_SAMPLE_ID=MMETSP0105_2 /ASSEMBLY_ACC=CAM_ASM_000205 /LENGTH=74 /DNA_ID=CAMNT_0025075467 /DNA_START=8 /DNA_END=229 /DNA_ORIENTATION=+